MMYLVDMGKKTIKIRQAIWLDPIYYGKLAEEYQKRNLSVGLNAILSRFIEEHEPSQIFDAYERWIDEEAKSIVKDVGQGIQ